MKNLILFVIILSGLQVAKADVMAKCSIQDRGHEISGVNFLMSNNDDLLASGIVFFKDAPEQRLEGQYRVNFKTEDWYYGSDIAKSGEQRKVKVISVSFSNKGYSAKSELSFHPDSTNERIYGDLSVTDIDTGKVISYKKSIICDVEDTLRE